MRDEKRWVQEKKRAKTQTKVSITALIVLSKIKMQQFLHLFLCPSLFSSLFVFDKTSAHVTLHSPPIPHSFTHFSNCSVSTHHSCLFGGMQSSLLEAVTPMAICITVMYFWYFILSTTTTTKPT